MMKLIGAALVLMSTNSFAQGVPTEFPPEAVPISDEALVALAGKTFAGKRFDGRTWKMEFGAERAYRFSQSGAEGGSGDGKVRVEGAKLCQDMRRTLDSGCNDVRLKDNLLLYKRNSNGEVVTLIAQ